MLNAGKMGRSSTCRCPSAKVEVKNWTAERGLQIKRQLFRVWGFLEEAEPFERAMVYKRRSVLISLDTT